MSVNSRRTDGMRKQLFSPERFTQQGVAETCVAFANFSIVSVAGFIKTIYLEVSLDLPRFQVNCSEP